MPEALVSVIVPVLNMEHTITRAMDSITGQCYSRVEIIVVDGCSEDGTVARLEPYSNRISQLVSEPDQGVYHAINKGIELATGEVIAILNADDYYANDQVLGRYMAKFASSNARILFGDLEFFRAGNPQHTIRTYSSKQFTVNKLRYGWMPPHPTTIVRRSVYEEVGDYRTDYLISADFEFLVRALWQKGIEFDRIDSVVVRMQYGGLSTKGINATYILNKEIIRACRSNGLPTGWPTLLLKFPKKLLEFRTILQKDETTPREN